MNRVYIYYGRKSSTVAFFGPGNISLQSAQVLVGALPDPPPDPTPEPGETSYRFAGWFTETGSSDKPVTSIYPLEPVNGDTEPMNIIGKWAYGILDHPNNALELQFCAQTEDSVTVPEGYMLFLTDVDYQFGTLSVENGAFVIIEEGAELTVTGDGSVNNGQILCKGKLTLQGDASSGTSFTNNGKLYVAVGPNGTGGLIRNGIVEKNDGGQWVYRTNTMINNGHIGYSGYCGYPFDGSLCGVVSSPGSTVTTAGTGSIPGTMVLSLDKDNPNSYLFTITYEFRDSSIQNNTVEAYYGDSVSLVVQESGGRRLTGWYVDESLQTECSYRYVTHSLTLYAKWEA